MRFMKLGDKILIVFLIFLSLFSFWYIKKVNEGVNERYVSVQINGEEYKRLQFATDEPYQETIQTQQGRNVIEVGVDFVHVVEADCKDKLDVLQGEISKPGQVIVCLPNRMVIEVRGEKEDDGPIIDDTVR